jgi:ribosomal protein L7/L12
MSTTTTVVLVAIVIVLAGLLLAARIGANKRAVSPGYPLTAAPELTAQARELVVAGRPIHAIKLVRARTGWNLVTAKTFVDQLDAPAGPGEDLDGRLRVLVADGRKLDAIKLVRQATGFGLADARDYVEDLDDPRPTTEYLDATARDLVARGKTINAIKLVREKTSLSLADAKAYVEQLGDGQSGAQLDMTDLNDAVRALLAERKAIMAVKLVRESTGWDLATAKDYVDHLR